MLPAALLSLIAMSTAAPTNPPDISLDTLPTVYYGANWNRTQQNIDVLARFQMVVLMQEDGHCWATCCPDHMSGPGQCGPLRNATDTPGCDSSCAQHGAQAAVFARMKASAATQKRRPGHAVLYMNSVYLWPFDKASGQGTAVQVLDVNGNPHMETCDPGIYPSFFWDFGRAAGRKAWLDIITDHIVNGPADGVYDDCDGTIPIKCPDPETDPGNNTCRANRNGHLASVNDVVTRAQMDAYIAGKNETMSRAAALIGPSGSFYNKNARKPTVGGPTFGGGNLQFINAGKGNPSDLIDEVREALENYKYLVVGGANDFSNPQRETLPPGAPGVGQNLADGRSLRTCPPGLVALFLLAVQPGAFLLCNGWDKRFDRKLGLPLGDAVIDNHNGVITWSRSFAGGAKATYDLATKTGAVTWPGFPPTPPGPPAPAPRPHPPSPPGPPWTGPPCPGPECPVVPASNYKGCYHDRSKGAGCDLPCRPPGASGGCGAWSKGSSCLNATLSQHGGGVAFTVKVGADRPGWPGAPDSVERCNQLCLSTGVRFKYFGMQAGHACFCGMGYGAQGQAADRACDARCLGNETQMCGGPYLNSVWATQPL